MTPFLRLLRRWRDKYLGTFYEGEDAPDRLAVPPVLFAQMHPGATRADWVAFATEFAREAYRTGWVRGYEHAERDPQVVEVEPAVLADAIDPSWRDEPWTLDEDAARWDRGIPGDEEVVDGEA